MHLRSLVESAHDIAGRVGMREQLDLASAPASRRRARFFSLAARPAMAVPPAKGLDEACAWLRKAALTPSPTGH
jgi:hypothetical protein